MKESSPTPAEWRALYDAAVAFRDLAPWRWLEEDQLFGVENPDDGCTGYCCVMGAAGEHFALGVYRGAEGLEGFWKIREQALDIEGPGDMLALQHCLTGSFEDRERVEAADREVIRSLDLKFRGRGQWPVFRSYRPEYWPWMLDGAEARFLTTCLCQAVEVTERARVEPALLPHASPGGPLLVRVPHRERGGLAWKDVRRAPEATPQAPPPPPQPEPARLRRAADLPATDGVLEVGWMRMPEPVQDGRDTRPYFVWSILLVEPSSGVVVGMDLAPFEVRETRLQQTVLSALERLKRLPEEVRVQDERIEQVLAPVTGPLGVRQSRQRRLPALRAVQRELAAFAGGPGW